MSTDHSKRERTMAGIHHVTAIAGPPQPNLDFYMGLLGLRFVKKTVNFDDPGTYHFYYGDEVGHPGTILTFFPWPDALPGRAGSGMAVATAFSIPGASLDYWMGRFADRAYDFEAPQARFDEAVLSFRDPDGLHLELVTHTEAGEGLPRHVEEPGWEGGPVPTAHTLRSFHSVTLCVEGYERTARLLTETFSYEAAGEEETPQGHRFRFRSPGQARGNVVDLLCQPQRPGGRMGAGVVHHVAFRTKNEDEQLQWREEIAALGFNVTPVLDRQYFKSIYFREPGGVLFEIATDPPGFTRDEPADALGTQLKLPPWLEPRRTAIEQRLPQIIVSAPTKAG